MNISKDNVLSIFYTLNHIYQFSILEVYIYINKILQNESFIENNFLSIIWNNILNDSQIFIKLLNFSEKVFVDKKYVNFIIACTHIQNVFV